MAHPRILLQLDPDTHASSFDAVVAIDAGVDHLLQYAQVTPSDVRDLVYGAIFTRSPQALASTAIFIGGKDVSAGETLLAAVRQTFFGPLRVSVMLDANGANTTASAAVLALARHVEPPAQVVVLAGTGSVGRRVARLAAQRGYPVRLVSRTLERAQAAVAEMAPQVPSAPPITAAAAGNPSQLQAALADAQAIVAAGAPGIELISSADRSLAQGARVLIDLNAVPPLGIAGIQVTDHQVDQQGQFVYGAIGVGGIKMKLHRAAIQQLFTSNQLVLDAEQILALGSPPPSAG